MEQLQEYDFNIIHRPGRLYGNADALSGIPCRQCGRTFESQNTDSQDEAPSFMTHAVMGSNTPPLRTTEELRRAQEKDPAIGKVLQVKRENKRPLQPSLQGESLETKRLFQLWDQLQIKYDLLWCI
jgi:hypothetical protein